MPTPQSFLKERGGISYRKRLLRLGYCKKHVFHILVERLALWTRYRIAMVKRKSREYPGELRISKLNLKPRVILPFFLGYSGYVHQGWSGLGGWSELPGLEYRPVYFQCST